MRAGRDTIAGDRAELEVLQRQFCCTAPFRLEIHLEQGAGAGRTLSGEPCRVESCDFPRCIVNASALKESCAATRFQKIAFTHIDSFKNSGVEGNIKLPARHIKNIFCTDVEGKGIAYMNWRLRKAYPTLGFATVYSVPRSNPKKPLLSV